MGEKLKNASIASSGGEGVPLFRENQNLVSELRTDRRAALNLMEDAVLAKQQSQILVDQLRSEVEARKKAEKEVKRTRDYAEAILRTSPVPLLVLESDLSVATANDAFYQVFDVDQAETEGRLIYDLGNGQWNFPGLRRMLESILPEHTAFDGLEVTHDFETIGPRTMLLNARRLDDESSMPDRLVLVIEDITDRKWSDESNARLAAIVQSTEDAIVSKDMNGVITSWNNGAEKLFGYTSDETVGQPVTILIPTSHHDEEPIILKRILQGETVDHYETVRQRKDGTLFDVSLTVSPLRDKAGKIIGASKIARDITERKRTEAALAASEARYRTLSEAAPAMIWFDDEQGNCRSVNQKYLDFVGMTEDEVKGTGWHLILHPDDSRDYIDDFYSAQHERRPFHHRVRARRNDGEWRWIESFAQPLFAAEGAFLGHVGISPDITASVEAEEALRESEEKYRALFDSMDEGYCIIEVLFDAKQQPIDYRFVQVNSSFERQAGMHDVVGKRMLEFVSAIETHWLQNYSSVALTGEPVRFSGEYRGLHRYFDVYAFRAEGWPPNHVAVLFADVTSGTKAEEDLRESEERLRLLIDSATEIAIFTTDGDGVVNSWNEGARRTYGFEEDEIIGESAKILFTPEDRKRNAFLSEMRTAKQKGRAMDERWHLRKDGSRFFASGLVQPLGEDRGQGYVRIVRDMTARLVADESKREREMLKFLVDTQEGERKRIARDLHDELGQQLTALRWKLERVHMEAPKALDEAVSEIREIAKQIDEGVDFLAWELRPAALDDLGLLPAIEKYVEEWSAYSGVAASVDAPAFGNRKLDPALETTLYRIVQEGLNNVHKHASAKTAQVTITIRKHDLALTIDDDGIGFNATDVSNRSQGIGLLGMEERVKMIGGKLDVESGSQQGTTIYVSAPLIRV